MTFRFRHSTSVTEGIRLVKGPKIINLSDLSRAKAWSDHDQNNWAPLTQPSSGLQYFSRFSHSKAHQHRAFVLREQQKWHAKGYDLSFTLSDKTDVKLTTLTPLITEDGDLQLRTEAGTLLSDEDIARLWVELPQYMRALLEEQVALLNGPLYYYPDMHLESPQLPQDLPAYIPSDFNEEPPKRPDALDLPPEPAYPQPPAIKLWHRLIPGRQQQMARAHQQQLHDWQTAKLRWKAETHQAKSTSDRARQRHKAYLSMWKARKLAHDAEQQVYAEQFATLLLNDEMLMVEVLNTELQQLDWPSPADINYQLDLNGKTAWIDVELPRKEIVSWHKADLITANHRVKLRLKTEQQVAKEYAHCVYGILLRVAGVVLSSLPGMDEAVVSGYTQVKDEDTGYDHDEFLVSVRMTREQYASMKIQYDHDVDPRSLLQGCQLVESISSGKLTHIQPFEPKDPLA